MTNKPEERWWREVPKTEAECLEALRRDDELLTNTLQNMFKCHLGMGKPPLEAYELTLRAHIEPKETS